MGKKSNRRSRLQAWENFLASGNPEAQAPPARAAVDDVPAASQHNVDTDAFAADMESCAEWIRAGLAREHYERLQTFARAVPSVETMVFREIFTAKQRRLIPGP